MGHFVGINQTIFDNDSVDFSGNQSVFLPTVVLCTEKQHE